MNSHRQKIVRHCRLVMGLVGVFFLLTAFVNGTPLDAAPHSRYVRTLLAYDRLIVKSQGCRLHISTQTAAKIIVRCINTPAPRAVPQEPHRKSTIVLTSGDKVIANANGCQLQTVSVSTTRVLITCATASSNWLAYVNAYRSLANLPAVTENSSWSYGNWLHSRYMVKNNFIGHTEDPGNKWYTKNGLQAAQSSDLVVSSSANLNDHAAIDLWMQGPFHAVGIIDPALSIVGYNSYREADGGYQSGAGLDVRRGLGAIPSAVTFPVMYPDNGKTISLYAYNGGESPNPLASCAGYAAPTGLPIILQIGDGSLTPNVTAHSFRQGSTELEHCIYDETNYTNANASEQSLVRSILGARDAIVLIPHTALTAGQTYTVSITTNGATHTWSFTVSSSAQNVVVPDARMQ